MADADGDKDKPHIRAAPGSSSVASAIYAPWGESGLPRSPRDRAQAEAEMTKEEKLVVAMREILQCIIVLGSQANNFSNQIISQIGLAEEAIAACAALKHKRNRRKG